MALEVVVEVHTCTISVILSQHYFRLLFSLAG